MGFLDHLRTALSDGPNLGFVGGLE